MADVTQNPPTGEQRQTRALTLTMRTSVTGVLTPTTLAEAMDLAKLVAFSGMVPKQFEERPGAVLVAMQMGAELGLSPMASLQNIAVVNGRPTVWGDACLAIVTSHPECLDVVETEGDGFAKCTVRRRGRAPVERVFSVEDAKRAGLWGKQGPWTQYPKRMMQMRARGFALRDAFPDALRGIVSTEEARDYDVPATPEHVDPGAIPEGTHKFGFAKPAPARAAARPVEEPHDPSTGEVRQAAPVEGDTREARERAFREKHAARRKAEQAPLEVVDAHPSEDGFAPVENQ